MRYRDPGSDRLDPALTAEESPIPFSAVTGEGLKEFKEIAVPADTG